MSASPSINGPDSVSPGSHERKAPNATRRADVVTRCEVPARSPGHDLFWFRSNAEHERNDRTQQAARRFVGNAED